MGAFLITNLVLDVLLKSCPSGSTVCTSLIYTHLTLEWVWCSCLNLIGYILPTWPAPFLAEFPLLHLKPCGFPRPLHRCFCPALSSVHLPELLRHHFCWQTFSILPQFSPALCSCSTPYTISLPIPSCRALSCLKTRTTPHLCMPSSRCTGGAVTEDMWPHGHDLLTKRSSGVSLNKTRNSLHQDTFLETKHCHRIHSNHPRNFIKLQYCIFYRRHIFFI